MKSIKYTLVFIFLIIFKVTLYSQSDKTAGSDTSLIELISNSTEVDLSRKNLTEIPDYIYTNKNLYYLNLSNNSITEVSSKIENLNNLRVLDLTGNDIYYLPEELNKLKFLKELYLDYDDWHWNISQLKKLTRARIFLK